MAYQIEPIFAHAPRQNRHPAGHLGTPDAPTPQAVRSYLREFLGDPRVVEIPKAIWWLILNGIILNTRPKKIRREIRLGLAKRRVAAARPYRKNRPHCCQGYLGERTKAPFVSTSRCATQSFDTCRVAQTQGTDCQRILLCRCIRNMREQHRHRLRHRVRRIATNAQHPALRTIKKLPRPSRLHQGAGEQHQRILDEKRPPGKSC